MQRVRARKSAKYQARQDAVSLEPARETAAARQPELVQGMEPKLHFSEIVIYLVVSSGLLLKAFYSVYISSQKYADDFGPYIVEPGWSIFGNRPKDISDFEWSYWTSVLTPLTVLLLFGHVILGQIIGHHWPQMKRHYLLVYSLLCLTGLLGVRTVFIYLLDTTIGFLASQTKSQLVVWVVILLEILSFQVNITSDFMQSFFRDEEEYNHVIFGTALCHVRLLSFGLEYCKHAKQSSDAGTLQKHTSQGWSFFDLLVYNFYLPVFASGPILTYDKFSQQISQAPRPVQKSEVQKNLKEFARYVFWLLFIEITLHFLYFPAFHQVTHIFQFLPTWSLAGVGLCHLLFFQVKYLVTYGIPRAVALWDGIEAPLAPICVLAMYTFQDMWRYFDRGLYALLLSTIYFPVGGSQHGLLRQFLASLLCFTFVFLWHGVQNHIFYWAIINWCGIVFEILVQKGDAWLGITAFLKGKLHPSNYCRLLGIILTPNFMALALSNLVFLGGVRTTNIYYYRLMQSDSLWTLPVTALTFYCVLQVTKAAHQHFGKMYLCKKLYVSKT